MKKKSSLKFYITLAVLALTAIAMVRHFHIDGFKVIAPGKLYVSGQPQGMDYTRLLYKYHVATIANVRLINEHRDHNWYSEEISFVRAKGIAYIELPIHKHSPIPDNETIERFLEIVNDPARQPVLVHGSGNMSRAAMLAAVYMVKVENAAVADAAAKARKIQGQPLSPEQASFIDGLGFVRQASKEGCLDSR